jgi:signal transduction histidine kinase
MHLINGILDVAKIESGRLSLESVSFDLEDVVGKAIETMSVRAHAKGLELTARILPHVPHLGETYGRTYFERDFGRSSVARTEGAAS